MADIFAAPYMKTVMLGDTPIDAYDLQTALNKARPGDIVHLTKGTYNDPVTLAHSGEPGKPITIRGPGDGSVVLNGRRFPEQGLIKARWIMDGDWSFFKFFGVAHVQLQGLAFRNCWPNAIYIRGGQDLVFQDLDVKHGRNVIYARNSIFRKTRRILLDRVAWVQDPDHDMWEGRVTWREAKGLSNAENKSWFNGALFQSYRVTGDVTIRNCKVSHAFNAVRMKVAPSDLTGKGTGKGLKLNRNIRIYHNHFSYIRDNAIEPEIGLKNWFVAENKFFQVHAALSLDGVTIWNLTFLSNRMLNVSRPKDVSNTGGKIIKFVNPDDEPLTKPSRGFVTAFNSIRTRTRFVKGARLKPWTSANDAIERFAPTPADDMAVFRDLVWHPDVTVSAMVTNDCDYPVIHDPKGTHFKSHPAVTTVFKPNPVDPEITKDLGGWDGALELTSQAKCLRSVPVRLVGPDGKMADIKTCRPPGYQSLKALGFDHWLM